MHFRINKLFILLIPVFLGSCTMLQKAGIEKRRYRPGFFLNTHVAFSPHIHAMAHAHIAVAVLKSEAKNINGSSKTNINAAVIKATEPLKHFHTGIPKSGNKIAGTVSKVITSSAYTNAADSEENLTAASYYSPPHIENDTDLLAYILVLLLTAAITFGLVAVFPALSVDGAELLATVILLLAILLISLVSGT